MLESSRGKQARRLRRKRGIRKRVYGESACPRLTVSRSLKNISAQLVDDDRGVTVWQASSLDKELRTKVKYWGNVAAAKVVGEVLAERATAKNITSVRFDRNGYRFHGRVKALADGARDGGLKF